MMTISIYLYPPKVWEFEWNSRNYGTIYQRSNLLSRSHKHEPKPSRKLTLAKLSKFYGNQQERGEFLEELKIFAFCKGVGNGSLPSTHPKTQSGRLVRPYPPIRFHDNQVYVQSWFGPVPPANILSIELYVVQLKSSLSRINVIVLDKARQFFF